MPVQPEIEIPGGASLVPSVEDDAITRTPAAVPLLRSWELAYDPGTGIVVAPVRRVRVSTSCTANGYGWGESPLPESMRASLVQKTRGNGLPVYQWLTNMKMYSPLGAVWLNKNEFVTVEYFAPDEFLPLRFTRWKCGQTGWLSRLLWQTDLRCKVKDHSYLTPHFSWPYAKIWSWESDLRPLKEQWHQTRARLDHLFTERAIAQRGSAPSPRLTLAPSDAQDAEHILWGTQEPSHSSRVEEKRAPIGTDGAERWVHWFPCDALEKQRSPKLRTTDHPQCAWISSLDGGVYSLRKASLGSSQIDFVWRFATKDKVYGTPVYWQGKVYFGAGLWDRNVYAVDADTGKEVWRFDTGWAVVAPVAINEKGWLAAVNGEGQIFILNAETGEWIGHTALMAQTVDPPVWQGNRLYIRRILDHKIYAFEISTAPAPAEDRKPDKAKKR